MNLPLPEPAAPGAGALALARARMLEEARRPRGPSWKASLALVAGVGAGLLAVIAAGGLFSGSFSTELIVSHLSSLLLLVGVTALLWVAAFAPRSRGVRLASLASGALAMALLVVLRPETAGVDTSRFACTFSHLGVALVPAVVTVTALRRAAFSVPRALAAGLGVGALGAFAGELGCHQGPVHVLFFHLSAWLITTTTVTLVASRLRPRSFAP